MRCSSGWRVRREFRPRSLRDSVAPSNSAIKALRQFGDHHQIAALPGRSVSFAFRVGSVDPADVRKVALEEPPGNLPLTSDKVEAAHKTLFARGSRTGSTIMPAAISAARLEWAGTGVLMYPQAKQTESAGNAWMRIASNTQLQRRNIRSDQTARSVVCTARLIAKSPCWSSPAGRWRF